MLPLPWSPPGQLDAAERVHRVVRQEVERLAVGVDQGLRVEVAAEAVDGEAGGEADRQSAVRQHVHGLRLGWEEDLTQTAVAALVTVNLVYYHLPGEVR